MLHTLLACIPQGKYRTDVTALYTAKRHRKISDAVSV